MTKDEALTLALEALETCGESEWYSDDDFGMSQIYDEYMVNKAITAIKEALAQTVSSHGNAEDLYVEMSKHLNCPHCGGSGHIDDVAQPEQEPVAYWKFNNGFSHCMIDQLNQAAKKNPAPLYTTLPQRTWVGLTDRDVDGFVEQYWDNDNMTVRSMMRAIEAKLKEKNT